MFNSINNNNNNNNNNNKNYIQCGAKWTQHGVVRSNEVQFRKYGAKNEI